MSTPARGRTHATRPRGAVIIWVIVGVLVAFLLLCLVAEAGNLWLARLQLQNAMEAAALGAVDEWGDAGGGPPTLAARQRGVAIAAANTVAGNPVTIGLNRTAASAPNENTDCDGNLVFAALTGTSPNVADASMQGGCGGGAAGAPVVRAQARVTVSTLCVKLIGFTSFQVSAQVDAVYDCGTGEPSLIQIDSFICP